jgi:hypothetical protein
MYSSNADQDPRYGKIVGTADYLSPDHIQSPWSPIPAWDIYSLGCTLYYAVTGKVPFPGGTTKDKARAHTELKPLDPRRLNHLLSDAFVDVIADMMAKDPAQRIPSALAVIERLSPWAKEFQNRRQSAVGGVPSPLAIERPIAPSALAITPMEPMEPVDPQALPAAPPFPAENQSSPPVVPPPVAAQIVAAQIVAAQAVAGWEWDNSSSGDSPPLSVEALLRDTLPDLPAGLEGTSDSEVSMSMVVRRPRRLPIGLLVALVLAPIVLVGLGLAVAWMLNITF